MLEPVPGTRWVPHRLRERYIGAAYRARYPFSATLVPKTEYFGLGDNRNNNQDSHLKGMVTKRYILDQAVMPRSEQRSLVVL